MYQVILTYAKHRRQTGPNGKEVAKNNQMARTTENMFEQISPIFRFETQTFLGFSVQLPFIPPIVELRVFPTDTVNAVMTLDS